MGRAIGIAWVLLALGALTESEVAHAGLGRNILRAVYRGSYHCMDVIASPFGMTPGTNLHVQLNAFRRWLNPSYLTEIDRTGMTLRVGEGGYQFAVRLGAFRGMGALGVVYDAKIEKYSSAFLLAYPELFINGKPREDLVVKVARGVPPHRYEETQAGIRRESEEFAILRDAFRRAEVPLIETAEIFFEQKHPFGLLLKRRVDDAVDFGAALGDSDRLTEEQIDSLRRDIYEPFARVKSATGMAIDAGPGNLYWYPQENRWGLYEMTFAFEDHFSFVGGRRGFETFIARSYEYWNNRFTWIQPGVTPLDNIPILERARFYAAPLPPQHPFDGVGRR